MRVICIDDEYFILQRNISVLKKIPKVYSVEGFLSGEEALEYLNKNSADVIFLDVNMPDINGLELATRLREKCPDVIFIFLTAYNEFAVDAFKLRANGYLVKPVGKEEFEEEIQNAERILKKEMKLKISVRTFGNFDLFVNDKIISFQRNISKELLAYLICKRGTCVTRRELAGIIWEDLTYDRPKQKQLDVYIRSMLMTLKEYGIEKIVEKDNGVLRVKTRYLDCDYYKYLEGDLSTRSQFFGEFMNNYSWAEFWKEPFMGGELTPNQY